MDNSEAARDARRETNTAITRRISQKLLNANSRLTKDERHTAGQILAAVADLIGDKPTERDLPYFWHHFDIALNVRINIRLGEGWGSDTGGVL